MMKIIRNPCMSPCRHFHILNSYMYSLFACSIIWYNVILNASSPLPLPCFAFLVPCSENRGGIVSEYVLKLFSFLLRRCWFCGGCGFIDSHLYGSLRKILVRGNGLNYDEEE